MLKMSTVVTMSRELGMEEKREKEECNKDRDKRSEPNNHENMKCRQKKGDWFTQSCWTE